jgi:hypothetical protein
MIMNVSCSSFDHGGNAIIWSFRYHSWQLNFIDPATILYHSAVTRVALFLRRSTIKYSSTPLRSISLLNDLLSHGLQSASRPHLCQNYLEAWPLQTLFKNPSL